jgi:hypothetical protein
VRSPRARLPLAGPPAAHRDAEGAPAAARAHLERARKRIEETGYHRRDEELAGLEAEAGSTGA